MYVLDRILHMWYVSNTNTFEKYLNTFKYKYFLYLTPYLLDNHAITDPGPLNLTSMSPIELHIN